jgi:hypothetical protein
MLRPPASAPVMRNSIATSRVKRMSAMAVIDGSDAFMVFFR